MAAPRQHQGLLASALVIAILAVATFLATKSKASQLKSFSGGGTSSSNVHEVLLKSVNISDTASRHKHSAQPVNDYGMRGNVSDGRDGVGSKIRGSSKTNSPAQELLSKGAKEDAGELKENMNHHDQRISNAEGKISGKNRESKTDQISGDEASDDDETDDDQTDDDQTDDDQTDDNVGELDDEKTDDDEINDELYKVDQLDNDPVLGMLSPQIKHILSNNTKTIINNNNEATTSPACHPHFRLSLPNHRWNNTTKFRRIYFYHARKAGGSSMHKYLAKVAEHYNIELKATEWTAMEDPGTNLDNATFYVTHLREPVDRAISHFKYQGRWSCKELTKQTYSPSEENANKLEAWNQTGGHVPSQCRVRKYEDNGRKSRAPLFMLGECAVNCYSQWFSGLSCPEWGIPVDQQYQVAKEKLLKYNLVVVIEKLRDPNYVQAVEDIFGVPGITERGQPFCERPSHKANQKHPLIVHNNTREKLTRLNQVDIKFYHEMTSCLDSGRYNFPKWDPSRFELNSTDMWIAKAAKKLEKESAKRRAKADKEKKEKKKKKKKKKEENKIKERRVAEKKRARSKRNHG